jgi:hypothetical protein
MSDQLDHPGESQELPQDELPADLDPPSIPDMKALERAEQDLSLYAAILGRRPTVCPDEDAEERKRYQLSLHLNLPRPNMPSLRLPPVDDRRLKMTTWLKQCSRKALKRIDEALMRLAS